MEAAVRHFEAKMSSKGQLTVPAELRRLLGLEEGDVVDFLWDGAARQASLRARNLSVDALFGCAGSGSIETREIDEAVAAEVEAEDRAATAAGRTAQVRGEAAE